MENKTAINNLGDFLRQEREKRHITIEQVASATKISIKLLHALESDNYDSLPAKPFVRGFVSSYARYIGLNPKEILNFFDSFLDQKTSVKFKRPADAPHIFVERSSQVDHSKTILSIIMVSFVVVAAVAFAILKPSLKHRHHKGKEKVSVSNEELVTVLPAGQPSIAVETKTESKEANKDATKEPNIDSTAEVESLIQQKSTSNWLLVKKSGPTPTAATAPNPPITSPTIAATAAPTPAPEPVAVKAEKKPVTKSIETINKPAQPATANATTPPTVTSTLTTATSTVKVPPIANHEVKHRFIVRAKEDAWVKYQVDDRPLQQFTLKKEKTIFIRAKDSIRFTTPKPQALEFSFDNSQFKNFETTQRTTVIPKTLEAQYKEKPFVDPNPAYLSTPHP